jgi:hypothetical protein
MPTDEDSEPGHGTKIHDPIARERLKAQAARLDEINGRVERVDDEISDVKKVQIGHGATISELVGFHKDLKSYARLAIVGLFGAVALQVLQLVLKKGTP